jgi:type I restriction-modification system DNA methylase subunit
MIEADLVDCMVALPGQLFYSTQIPVCLWFLARNKRDKRFRNRAGETLFIDARKLGVLIDRVHRELTDEEVARVAGTYHAWRGDKRARIIHTLLPHRSGGGGDSRGRFRDVKRAQLPPPQRMLGGRRAEKSCT